MKARLAPKRMSHSEALHTTQSALEICAPAAVAATLYILYRRGWHKDKLLSLYKEIVCLFKYPQAFGKWIDDTEVKNLLSERIGIDWDELVDAVKVEGNEGKEATRCPKCIQ